VNYPGAGEGGERLLSAQEAQGLSREFFTKHYKDERCNWTQKQRKKEPVEAAPVLRLCEASVEKGQCTPPHYVAWSLLISH